MSHTLAPPNPETYGRSVPGRRLPSEVGQRQRQGQGETSGFTLSGMEVNLKHRYNLRRQLRVNGQKLGLNAGME